VDDPDLGPIEVVAPPIKLSVSPALEPPADRETIGPTWVTPGLEPGGTAEGKVLTEGPLTGVRVLELSTFFAAPYANRFLRDLGAEVIKVEGLSGDPMRSLPDPFEGVARGKRSIAIDLKSDATRPVVEALMRWADVVQHNFRPGVAERLGVDAAAVRAVNPDVIYSYAPGFGSSGPKSRLQSFAPLMSGLVGIQVEAAGDGNVPTITFGNEDYYNGQLNAIGALLALIHRDRTGRGQDVECAQLSSSVFVMSHWYRAGRAAYSALGALDHQQLGWSPYQRLYQCLDGHLCVCCTDRGEERALREAILGDGVNADDDDDGTADRVQYELFGRVAGEWRDELSRAGVPCVVAAEGVWLLDHLTDPSVQAAGRATAFDHHQAGPVSVIGQIVRLESTPPREPVQAPRAGEQTGEILDELGLAAEVVAGLRSGGFVGSPGEGP
jgi:crotonobetainyl-CoA:carnitine CoA-transferase CaiB-like acyl-CoA transferase